MRITQPTFQQYFQAHWAVNFSAKAKKEESSSSRGKHSEAGLALWQQWQKRRPTDAAKIALQRLTPIKANTLLVYTIATRKAPPADYFIPRYIPEILGEVAAKKRTKKKPPPASRLKAALKSARDYTKQWNGKGATAQTLCALTEMGYKMKDIQKALGISHNAITAARRCIGLGPTTNSRQVMLDNLAQAEKVPSLSVEELQETLKQRGYTTPLTALRIEDFQSIQSLSQQAFVADTQWRSQHKNGPTNHELADVLNQKFELKISPAIARDRLDEARAALQIETNVKERYDTPAAREIHNERILKTIEAQFQKLPKNWKPNATDEETTAAKKIYKTLKGRYISKVAFSIYCEDQSRTNKEISKLLRERHGIIMTPSRVCGAVTLVKRALGIQTRAGGQKRLETMALNQRFEKRIPKRLPKLGEFYAYGNEQEAKQIWESQTDETSRHLTNYEKAVFWCFASESTKTGDEVGKHALLKRYEERFNAKREADSLFAVLSRARKKLGLTATPRQERQQQIDAFNANHQRYAKNLPPYWYKSLGKKEPIDEAQAENTFRRLAPLQRILFTLHCQYINAAKRTAGEKIKMAPFMKWLKTGKDLDPILTSFDPDSKTDRFNVNRFIADVRKALSRS